VSDKAVALPAKLNIAHASAVLPALAAQARQGSGALVVDAHALSEFDSAAIATLLELRRIAQASGRAFRVTAVPEAMIDLAKLYGVADLLALTASTEAPAA
jgi:phospholipid transport system transporter-binding protein